MLPTTVDIDFQAIAHLSKAPSKKYVRKLLEYALLVKSNLRSFHSCFQTPVSDNFTKDLSLTEPQAQLLLINMGKLIDAAGLLNFQGVVSLFPQTFDEQLKALLSEILQSMSDKITKMTQSRLTQAQRLISLDWRIDMQIATQSAKANKPVILMTLQTLDGSKNKTTSFQLSIQQISAFHENLKKIKQQLNKLVS